MDGDGTGIIGGVRDVTRGGAIAKMSLGYKSFRQSLQTIRLSFLKAFVKALKKLQEKLNIKFP